MLFGRLINLDTHLEKISTSLFPENNFVVSKYKYYVNEILLRKSLDNYYTTAFWIVNIFLIDTLLILSTIPIKDSDSYDDVAQYSIALLLQVLIMAFLILNISVIFFQWISYKRYELGSYMPKQKATLLYFSFLYLLNLESPVAGLIYGLLIKMCIIDQSYLSTLFLYGFAVFVVYLFIFVTSQVFKSTYRANFSIENGTFSAYEPVFSNVDQFVFFMVGELLPFNFSDKSIISVITCCIILLWGIVKTIYNSRPPFHGNFACFMVQRLYINAVTLGIFGVASFFIRFSNDEYNKQLLIYFYIYIIFLNIYISFYRNEQIRRDAYFFFECMDSPQTSGGMNSYFLDYLRTGISCKIDNSVSVESLSKFLENNQSRNIIPDIVKICISRDIPLSSIVFSVQQFNLMDFQFFAMQYRNYKSSLEKDGFPEIKRECDRLETQRKNLESTFDLFWTVNDPKNMTLCDLGLEIESTNYLYKSICSSYPRSINLRETWDDYTEGTLSMSSREFPVSRFGSFDPMYRNAFNFGMNKPKYVSKKPRLETTIEAYVNRKCNSIRTYYKIAYLSILLCFIIVVLLSVLYIHLYFITAHKDVRDLTNLILYNCGLGLRALKEADELVNLPSEDEITEILNITTDEAKSLRRGISGQIEAFPNLTSQVYYVPEDIVNVSSENCPRVSVTMGVYVENSGKRLMFERKCYLEWIVNLSDQISNYIQNQSKQSPDNSFRKAFFIVECIFTLFTSTISFIIFFSLIAPRVTRLLKAVRIILSVKTQLVESDEPDTTLKLKSLVVVWICNSALLLMVIYISFYAMSSFENDIRDRLLFCNTFSDLGRYSFLSFALKELSFYVSDEGSYYTGYDEIIKSYQIESIDSANTITTMALHLDIYSSIYPINNWFNETDNFQPNFICYSHSITTSPDSIDSYDFLISRYILINYLAFLYNETIPELTSSTLDSFHGLYAYIWLISSSLYFIFFVITLAYFVYSSRRYKLWIESVKFILRREMTVSKVALRKTIDIIEGRFPTTKIIDRINHPCFVINNEINTIIDCNEICADMCEATRESIIGQDVTMLGFNDANDSLYDDISINFSKNHNLTLLIKKDVSYNRNITQEKILKNLVESKIQEIPASKKVILCTFRFSCNGVDENNILNSFIQILRGFETEEFHIVFISVNYSQLFVVVDKQDNIAIRLRSILNLILQCNTLLKQMSIVIILGDILILNHDAEIKNILITGPIVERSEKELMNSEPNEIHIQRTLFNHLKGDQNIQNVVLFEWGDHKL